MCLSVPGKVVKIEGGTAVIAYGRARRRAKILGGRLGVKPRVGDFVLVQGGIIALKMPAKQARESLEAFSKIPLNRKTLRQKRGRQNHGVKARR